MAGRCRAVLLSLSLCLSGRRFVGWLADWLTLGDTTPGSDQVGGFGIRA